MPANGLARAQGCRTFDLKWPNAVASRFAALRNLDRYRGITDSGAPSQPGGMMGSRPSWPGDGQRRAIPRTIGPNGLDRSRLHSRGPEPRGEVGGSRRRGLSTSRASPFLFFRINFWTFRLFGCRILNPKRMTHGRRKELQKNRISKFFSS